MQRLYDVMEVVTIVIGLDSSLKRPHHFNGVTVNLQHVFDRHAIADRIKVIGIRQQETHRVTNSTIAFDNAFEDFIGNRQLTGIIGIGSPQTQNFGAHFVGYFLWVNHITNRFRHLAAFAINHKAMGEQALIRRFAI